MALFKEDTTTEDDSYIALLSNDGESLVAFISPVKGVEKEVLVTALTEKGLNVELRKKNTDALEFTL